MSWELEDLSFEWSEEGVVIRFEIGGELRAAMCRDGAWSVTGGMGAMSSEDLVQWLREHHVGVDDVTFLRVEPFEREW